MVRPSLSQIPYIATKPIPISEDSVQVQKIAFQFAKANDRDVRVDGINKNIQSPQAV
jgi:hypothetical protein